MAVENDTTKTGFREINVPENSTEPDEGKWTKSTNSDGHTVYTSRDPAATASIVWKPNDEQTHGTTQLPMNVGSTIETWIENGVQCARIVRNTGV